MNATSGTNTAAGAVGGEAKGGVGADNQQEIDNFIQDEMIDINRYRFNQQVNTKIFSTCPIVPKFHTTFGEPVDRQEISAEFEQNRNQDPKKGVAKRLMGRVDKIDIHTGQDVYLVTDDYGTNVMFDTSFADMRAVEQEMLKIVSFYINRVEPLQDKDQRNILPSVDRLGIVKEVILWEEKYQRAKLELALCYLECFEHTCDPLDQQRTIQILVDLMGRRPRMNFAANHFRDSYRAEIEGLELQTKIMRDIIKMQMENEFSANNDVREMLEKTYQLIYEQIDNNWQYYQKEDVNDEVIKRKIKKMGVEGQDTQDQLTKLKEIETKKPGMFNAKKQSSDPKQFAEMLGIPYHSLLMLMLNHHERDPLVKTSLHEHTSFIKI